MLYQVVVGKGLKEGIYYVEGASQALVFDYIWKEHKPSSALDTITIRCLKLNVEKVEGKHI